MIHLQVLGIATIVVNVIAIDQIAPKDQLILGLYIAVGSIVFLLSFFGCFGAIKESICVTWAVSFYCTIRYYSATNYLSVI